MRASMVTALAHRPLLSGCATSRMLFTTAAASAATTPLRREPTSSISVHKGLKIQAALCVERPPLRVIEPDFKRQWRVFREAWDLRTNNQLSIDDEIVFMRFHFHFFQDRKATGALASGAEPQVLSGGGGGGGSGGRSKKGRGASSALSAAGSSATSDGLVAALRGSTKGQSQGGIDALMGEEGLNLQFPDQGRKIVQRRKVEQKKVEEVDDSDLRSERRLGDRSLFLVVRYSGGKHWTFPKGDRAHGQPLTETLMRLCGRQLGPRFAPFVVGACPFTYRKRKSDLVPGIEGRKIFYYRGRLTPDCELVLPQDGLVTDWAWCSREELPSFLDDGEWHTVRESLPLDEVMPVSH